MSIYLDLAVLALMAVLLWKRMQIGHVMFICAVLFGLAHNMHPLELAKQLFATLLSPSSLNVLLTLVFITMLESVMREAGLQNSLVEGLTEASGNNRFTLASLPAVIGLLPSAGGARFSAPLVAEAAKQVAISSEQKAAINYYYRHIFEYFLPVYPSTLLAVEVLGIPMSRYILLMFPFTIVSTLAGFFLLKKIPATFKQAASDASTAKKKVLVGLLPITAVVVLVVFVDINILLALPLVTTVTFLYYRLSGRLILPIIRESLAWRLLYMVFAALYLRDVLLNSGSIGQMTSFFNGLGLGQAFFAVILPFTIGFLTGFPIPATTIVLPLVKAAASPDSLLPLAALSMVANISGTMFTPLHLCFIMSIEHFCADFAGSLRKVFLPQGLVMLSAFLYFFLL